MGKTFKEDGIGLSIYHGNYAYGNNTFLGLCVSEVPEALQEEYEVGEPWSDITVNLEGLEDGEFALDNDFTSFCSNRLVNAVLKEVAEEPSPHRYIQSGFVLFPVYKMKETYR